MFDFTKHLTIRYRTLPSAILTSIFHVTHIFCYFFSRSSHRRCSIKKGVVRNFAKFAGKHLCQSLFFNKVTSLKPATLLKKETLAQVLFCECCKISKKTFSYRTPPVAAPVKGFCKAPHLRCF